MIHIKCYNQDCPKGEFDWYEYPLDCERALPGEEGAVSFVAECPHCGYENKVWLKCVHKPLSMRVGLTKQNGHELDRNGHEWDRIPEISQGDVGKGLGPGGLGPGGH